jgi:WD40 repeat protein
MTLGLTLGTRAIRPRFCLLSLLGLSLSLLASGQKATAPPPTRTYEIPGNAVTADISPGVRLVALHEVEYEPGNTADARRVVDTVRLWDFKESRLVSRVILRTANFPEKGTSTRALRSERFVRFTPDGRFLTCYIEPFLIILRADDLSEVRRIRLVPDDTDKYVYALALSPRNALVAVSLAPIKDYVEGEVRIIDLEGAVAAHWKTRPSPMFADRSRKGIAWHPDGTLLVIALPNEMPCNRPSRDPDIFAYDVSTNSQVRSFRTGLLVGEIAVSADGKLFAVDTNCRGIFSNHFPPLRVFDVKTGKSLQEIKAKPSGVRYVVHASQDGRRIVAFTGHIKARMDFLEVTEVVVDRTYSVWSADSYALIAKSDDISGLREETMRLSRTGKYLLVGGKSWAVHELPD